VIAETPDYVAMASEYHALAGLPGITGARVFEPMPEEIHVWSR
jgi:methylamine---glutamate N-methyltransferase subunit A